MSTLAIIIIMSEAILGGFLLVVLNTIVKNWEKDKDIINDFKDKLDEMTYRESGPVAKETLMKIQREFSESIKFYREGN